MADGSNFELTLEELKLLTLQNGPESLENLKKIGGIDELCSKLRTDPTKGLSDQNDIEQRQKVFGRNVVPTVQSKIFLSFVWDALKDFTLIILLIAAVISFILGVYNPPSDESSLTWVEGVSILVAVLITVLVSALTDYQKEKQFRKLQDRITTKKLFTVIRGEEIKRIPVDNIVVGDICLVKYGDLIPADGIIIHSNDVEVDESPMTGESDQVKKGPEVNVVLLSCTRVMQGNGKMVVTAVGAHSQTGVIYSLVLHEEGKFGKSKSVLHNKLTKLARHIGYIAFIVSVLTFIILTVIFTVVTFLEEKLPWDDSYLHDYLRYVMIGVTMLVVCVPEGLPLAVTLSLAYSINKMTKDHNLVKHLGACETMGNATTICTDKTGTLTTNKMTVIQVYMCGKLRDAFPEYLADVSKEFRLLLSKVICVNCSYSSEIKLENGSLKQLGNKTECALLGFVMLLDFDYERVRSVYPEEKLTHVFTFSSDKKCMSTIIPRKGKGYRLCCKGATEVILPKCTRIHVDGFDVKYLTEEMRKDIIDNAITKMSNYGLRTIAIAYRNMFVAAEKPTWDNEEEVMTDLTFLAIVGIEDPMRAGVPEAVRLCQKAGITVRMVTGDSMKTARSIAVRCGILNPTDPDILVMDGQEFLKAITDTDGNVQQEKLDTVWPMLRVLARASPEEKYYLVKGIIESKLAGGNEVVAVTGDGTNDAPALMVSHVGFAMGVSGTDVAKEAADVILTDDDFSSIVKAVMWGRNVYDSIIKFLQFQLTVNLIAVVVMLVGVAILQDSILKAMQMLWVNLIMDTLAALGFASEPPSTDLLMRKPYPKNKNLLSKKVLGKIVGQSVYQVTVILVILFQGNDFFDIPSGRRGDEEYAGTSQHFTIIFNVFVLMTLFNQINTRNIHNKLNVFAGLFSNVIFCLIWVVSFTAQILIVEFGSIIFSTLPLTVNQWTWCLLLGVGTLPWGLLLAVLFNDKHKLVVV